ncbi:MAG: DUF4198 domain-containing protein [Planctomycetota bacterium]|nr:DUF4198 domain-containing protein [Planctomycetota bacterium]
MKGVILAVLLLCLVAPVARAHDSWLISDRQRVPEGRKVWLSFVTGEIFPLGDSPTDPRRVLEFVDLYGAERRKISGFAPQDKGLAVRGPIKGAGIHVFGCALKPRLIELEADKFDEYLKSERAERAIMIRAGRTERDPVTIERYTKFAKTLVEVLPASESDDGYRRIVGHRIEIVPLSNPNDWRAGGQARVRVLLDGHGWPDVPISAGHEGLEEHQYAVKTKTGPDGIATVALSRPGHWFIKAHVIRPTSGIGREQWESFWASLTFRVIGEVDVSGMLQAITAIHGDVRTGAVGGYRMGERALEYLGLVRNDGDMRVTVAVPLVAKYASIADGVQAATGASVGKLNLVLKNATNEESKVVFTNRATGRSILFLLTDHFKMMLAASTDSDADKMALRAATLPARDMYEIVDLVSPAKPQVPDDDARPKP